MKRILLFIFCFLCMSTVHAEETVKVKKVETNVFSTKTTIEGKTFTARLYYLYVDDKIAYCIEPGVLLQDQDYVTSSDFNSLGIGEEAKKRIELLAHYGYGYKNHTTIEYYMATQALLWEEIGATNITYTQNGSLQNIETYKQEIKKLMETNHTIPSFASQEYRVRVGDSLTLEDENRVIDRFMLTKGEGKIEGNTFTVSHQKEEAITYSFALAKRNTVSLVYFSPNSQKVATFSLSENNTQKFDIKVNYYLDRGKIILKKIDEITKIGLESAEFGLYDEKDVLLQTGKTDANGILVFDDLLYRKYYIKETKAPKGYIFKENKVEITLANPTYQFEVTNQKYEMPITSDTEQVYYQSSFLFLLLGMGAFYIVQKMS